LEYKKLKCYLHLLVNNKNDHKKTNPPIADIWASNTYPFVILRSLKVLVISKGMLSIENSMVRVFGTFYMTINSYFNSYS